MPKKNAPPTANPAIELQNRVRQTIADHDMCRMGDRILIGVSGGADSTALLFLMHALAEELMVQLGVCYLNHGLRPVAAEKESLFVREMAESLGLECHLGQTAIDSGSGSVEEKARIARYAFYQALVDTHGYTKIAVGHQMEDNAEAVLMHLLRGSGLRGLSGIAPVSQNQIIRPLIHCRRADIMAFLNSAGHVFLFDESNNDQRFLRNKIRLELIPYLERQYHPRIIETLNRTAGLCREEEQWLRRQSESILTRLPHTIESRRAELNLPEFRRVDRVMQRRVIREVLRHWLGHIRRIGAPHVASVIAMAKANQGRRRLSLPNGIQVERNGDRLIFEKTAHPRRRPRGSQPGSYQYSIASIAELPSRLEVAEAGYILHFSIMPTNAGRCPIADAGSDSIALDAEKLRFPLTIRNRHAGDRFHPFGMLGTQKVKQLLIDRKIHPAERERIPLLISADDIVWVIGVRRGAAAPLTDTTMQTLCITAIQAKKPDNLQTG